MPSMLSVTGAPRPSRAWPISRSSVGMTKSSHLAEPCFLHSWAENLWGSSRGGKSPLARGRPPKGRRGNRLAAHSAALPRAGEFPRGNWPQRAHHRIKAWKPPSAQSDPSSHRVAKIDQKLRRRAVAGPDPVERLGRHAPRQCGRACIFRSSRWRRTPSRSARGLACRRCRRRPPRPRARSARPPRRIPRNPAWCFEFSRSRNRRPSGPPTCTALHRAPARGSAADILDQFPQRHAEGRLEKPAMFHVACDLERHGPARPALPEGRRLVRRALLEDHRHGGERNDVVDHGRAAEEPLKRGQRRFSPAPRHACPPANSEARFSSPQT